MKKLYILLVGILLTSSVLLNNVVLAGTFSDLASSHPNYTAIEYLVSIGTLEGYSDGTFLASNNVNRAEIMKILVAGQGISPDASTYKNCYPDVNEEWFAKYVCYATEKGWVSGYPDGNFQPGNNVNKVEATKMFINALGLSDEVESQLDSDTELFDDTDNSAWYGPYLYLAKEKNLLEEMSDDFNPNMSRTRGGISENIFRTLVVVELELESYSTADSLTFLENHESETNGNETGDYTADSLYAYIAVQGASEDGVESYSNGYTVAVVDLLTEEWVDTIETGDVGSAPWFIVPSPDGDYVYVTNYRKHADEETDDIEYASDNPGEVVVIRTSDNTIVERIEVGYNPEELVITPDGQYLYVTNYANYGYGETHTLSKIDTDDYSAETIDLDHDFEAVGINPKGISISPDGDLLYVISQISNNDDEKIGTLEIVEVETDTVIGSTYVGYNSRTVEVRADGKMAYVTNTGQPQLDGTTSTSLSVVDVSDPTNPIVLEDFTHEWDNGDEMVFNQLAIEGDYLYCIPSPGVVKLDISRDSPEIVDVNQDDYTNFIWGVEIFPKEDLLVISSDPDQLILSESDTLDLVGSGEITITEGLHPQGIAIVDLR